MNYLGAHLSIAGGLYRACLRARKLGCNVLQIFTKNQRRWELPELNKEDVKRFKEARNSCMIKIAFAHESYLVNLASDDTRLWRRSYSAFLEEQKRAEKLGLSYLILHPGSSQNEKEGIKRLIKALNGIQKEGKDFGIVILLETTAGQGKNLGYTFSHFKEIINNLHNPGKVGLCFDTCHVFAAGYDIRTKTGYEDTMAIFEKTVGLKKLKVFHLNDSGRALGTKVDRHQHIGRGFLGLDTFSYILNDRRFKDLPKIIETPKENDMDRKNLSILRTLIKK